MMDNNIITTCTDNLKTAIKAYAIRYVISGVYRYTKCTLTFNTSIFSLTNYHTLSKNIGERDEIPGGAEPLMDV